MKTVQTPQGPIELLPAPPEVLQEIDTRLPFGLVRYPFPQQGATHGLVFQRGNREISGVKQQPVDCDEQQSLITSQANTLLIAHSLRAYLRRGFGGLLMPCCYIREKGGGRFESGIAHFGFPAPEGRECTEHPLQSAYDCALGHGFTTVMTSFIHALEASSRETGIPLAAIIGLDVRRRMQLGSIGFGFLTVGQHLVCLKTNVSKADPVWAALRSTGIERMWHLPSVPAAIAETD